MSDFVQTMKDWHRLCKTMTDRNPKDACDGCPLEAYGCSPVYEAIDSYQDVDFGVVYETITSWAAENPEPVYPTWEEWLVANGVMEPDNIRLNGDYRFYYNGKPVYNIPSPKMFDPIPADIAEKLGIEPKEG